MVLSTFFGHAVEVVPLPQNHIAPPPGRTHSCHSCHAFHCRHRCTCHPRISSPLQHVASVQSWSIEELHVYDDNERNGHLHDENMQFTDTPKTASINIGSPIVENFSACQKVLRHACSPTVRTHVFFGLPFHGHGVLHHLSGATGATVRSMSPRSSLLRAVCLHPLADTSRWSLGFKRTHFLSIHKCQFSPKNMSADMLKKTAHLTVLAVVPIASSEANTEHGIYRIS